MSSKTLKAETRAEMRAEMQAEVDSVQTGDVFACSVYGYHYAVVKSFFWGALKSISDDTLVPSLCAIFEDLENGELFLGHLCYCTKVDKASKIEKLTKELRAWRATLEIPAKHSTILKDTSQSYLRKLRDSKKEAVNDGRPSISAVGGSALSGK